MVFRGFIYRFATVDAFSHHSWFKSVDLFLDITKIAIAFNYDIFLWGRQVSYEAVLETQGFQPNFSISYDQSCLEYC